MKIKNNKITIAFVGLILSSLLLPPAIAAPVLFQYIYDKSGQLIKSIDSTGIVIEHIYDKVGNRAEVRRYTVEGLAIFGFSPKRGPIGQPVILQGQNFSANASDNLVMFNGVQADVVSATDIQLEVQVPSTATTGLISINVAGNTASTTDVFEVVPAPTITSIEPIALASKKGESVTIENFTVTGQNLTDASFNFLPQFQPLAIKVLSSTIHESGTSASLRLSIKQAASGSFTVVAKNDIGESDSLPSNNNTALVFDEFADSDGDLISDLNEQFLCTDYLNPDSDGDGFSDKDEQDFNSDPCLLSSTPWTIPGASPPDKIVNATASTTFSVLNSQMPPISEVGGVYATAIGIRFSLLNEAPPKIGSEIFESAGVSVGKIFTVINHSAPNIESLTVDNQMEAVGKVFSTLNEANPPLVTEVGVPGNEATGPAFSISVDQ